MTRFSVHKLSCFVLSLLFSLSLSAQTDREFWFVAPEISEDHEDRPINFTFITTNLPAHIKVEMPANVYSSSNPTGFNPYEFDVPAFSVYKLDVTSQINVIEDLYTIRDGIPGKNIKGIHITSNTLINCYYEVGNNYNPDIFTLLGNNALGTEFFTSFQTRAISMSHLDWTFPAYSAFEVVFTEDNTYLTIEIPAGKAVYNGAESPLSGTVTIGPFNRGETYQGAPAWVTNPKTGRYLNDLFGRSAHDHLAGTRLTTNGKKIAVTLKDDSMKALVGGCYNLAGDQTIPVHLTGTEYIVMKGQLSTGTLNSTYYNPPPASPVNQETIYVLATDDSTIVYIDGVPMDTLQAGETCVHEIVNPFTRVTASDSGVYVWQITGTGCECGGAILPSLSSCTGSTRVGFTRSTSDPFYIYVIVSQNAKAAFTAYQNSVVSANLTTALNNPANYTDIPGSQWAAARITMTSLVTVGASIMINNSIDAFQLGILNGGSVNGTRYAYFSNYGVQPMGVYIPGVASDTITICEGDSVQLAGTGGLFYKWMPASYISDPLAENPVVFPPFSTRYKTFIHGSCNQIDSADVLIQVKERPRADFLLPVREGNSPLTLQIVNTSQYSSHYEWKFGGDTGTYTITNPRHVFGNNLDTLQRIPIQLKADNFYCSDIAFDTIIVWPTLSPAFEMSKSSGCPPLQVTFTNTSTCNYTHASWRVGDSIFYDTGSFGMTFDRKFWPEDSIPVTLKLVNRFGKADSLIRHIRLYPPASLGIIQDNKLGCSPLLVKFSAEGAGNASHQWIIASKDTLTGASVERVFTNRTTVNKTYQILLLSAGENLCPSQYSSTVLVKTELSSIWSASAEICPGKQITCKPVVYGVHPPYQLKFSDGTIVENFRFGDEVTFSPPESGLITLLQLDDSDGCTLVSPNPLLGGSLSVNVLSPPEIISQYADQTVMEGDSVHLQIIVNGTAPLNYLWEKDGRYYADQPENEIFFASIQFTDSGNYQTTVSNRCGKVLSATGHLLVVPKTGIDNGKNVFMLYPNPANTVLYLDGIPQDVTSIEICSMDGRLVHSEKAEPVLQLDFLSEGIYLMLLMDRRGEQQGIYRFTVVRTR